MNDYQQPNFYKFNSDSLKLIQHVRNNIYHCYSLLDLGAGSGVLGIELANQLRPTKLTLLEFQKEFLPFLETNLEEQLKEGVKTQIVSASFGEWKTSEKFDLIVCNPPYYLSGHGQKSEDPNRHLCRTFERDGWEILLNLINEVLLPFGKAFLVVKNDPRVLAGINHRKLLASISHENDLVFVELSRK